MSSPDQNNASKWSELKQLLLEEESSRIKTLEGKVLHPEDFARYTAEVLADAVQETEDKARLSQKLYPVVEESIYKSVQKNPESLADAIYPVITPAIRKAINEALKKVTESVNASVNQGLTIDSLKWRIQALFSKHSYGELVLKYSLLYQVQEIYLIHNETGLLISHVSQKTGDNPDGDMISGMLTAIRDFVSDSFKTQESLDRIEVGDLTVILDQGPHATLAAVIKGDPSTQYQEELNQALEKIHQEFGTDLDKFDGNTAALEDTALFMVPCLVTQLDQGGAGEKSGKLKVIGGILAAVLVLLFGYIIYLKVESVRFNKQLQAHQYEVFMSTRNWRDYRVVAQDQFGLKTDSLNTMIPATRDSMNPSRLADEFMKKSLLRVNLIAYPSPLRKIQLSLGEDSKKVALLVMDGKVILNGYLPNAKIQRLKGILPYLADNYEMDYSHLIPEEYLKIVDLRKELEKQFILFSPGSTRLVDDQMDEIFQLNELLQRINEYCRELDQYWQLSVSGSTADTLPSPERTRLENERALFVVDQLIDKQLEYLYVKWVASKPSRREQLKPVLNTPEDWDHVSFELTLVH